MKRFRLVFLFVFMISCSSNQTALPTLIPKTSTPTLIPTPSPAITPSPSPSATVIPPTSTPVTPIPTLVPKEGEKYLLNLIETNGDCKLPCFLGIQPGISTWEDIRNVEAPLYFREQYIPNPQGSISIYTYIEKRVENFYVTFLGFNNIIEHITVDAKIYPPFVNGDYLPRFAKAMRRYFLPNVFSEYGTPSRILLHVEGQIEPYAGTQAEVLLFYDNLGFIVHYFFTNVVTQDRDTFALHTCLNYDHVENIRLYLQAPDNNIPLERMIDDGNSHYLNSWLHPLEEITTLSIEDFYNLYNGIEKTVCFDVP